MSRVLNSTITTKFFVQKPAAIQGVPKKTQTIEDNPLLEFQCLAL